MNVIVNNVNRVPVLEAIADLTIDETQPAIIAATAADPINNCLLHTINDTRFIQQDNLFGWQTGYEDSGEYHIQVNVTDGELTDSRTLTVRVENVNRNQI